MIRPIEQKKQAISQWREIIIAMLEWDIKCLRGVNRKVKHTGIIIDREESGGVIPSRPRACIVCMWVGVRAPAQWAHAVPLHCTVSGSNMWRLKLLCC